MKKVFSIVPLIALIGMQAGQREINGGRIEFLQSAIEDRQFTVVAGQNGTGMLRLNYTSDLAKDPTPWALGAATVGMSVAYAVWSSSADFMFESLLFSESSTKEKLFAGGALAAVGVYADFKLSNYLKEQGRSDLSQIGRYTGCIGAMFRRLEFAILRKQKSFDLSTYLFLILEFARLLKQTA